MARAFLRCVEGRSRSKWRLDEQQISAEYRLLEKGSAIYLHQDIFWVPLNVLQFSIFKSNKNDKDIFTNFKKVFISTDGSFAGDRIAVQDPAAYKAKALSNIDQCKRDSQYPNLRKNKPSLLTQRENTTLDSLCTYPPLSSTSVHMTDDQAVLRCLSCMPDLVNLSKLRGRCWWKDYLPPLREAGLLHHVRAALLSMTAGFGDAQKEPLAFVCIQVPFWYEMEDGSSLLVLENVRIVETTVRLLDGKANLSDFENDCSFIS